MLRRKLLLPLLLIAYLSAHSWAGTLPLLGAGSSTSVPPVTYIGPGDVVSGATVWYGLRAYNASNLNGTTKAINLIRASDSTACDFDIATTGGLGNSDAGCSLGGGITPLAFATADATASCTLSGATLSCTAASSTPHVHSQVTGAGIAQPCYASAIGTFTGGAGTVTLNNSQGSCGSVGTPEIVTFTYALRAAKWYDLTGNGKTLLQATNAKQPMLMQNCINTLPCLFFNAFDPDSMQVTITAVSDPVTVSSVAMRKVNIGGKQTIFSFEGGTNFSVEGFGSGANLAVIGQSADFTVTATDSVGHSFQYIPNGASSSINVDGTITTGSTTTGQTGATILTAGTDNNGSSIPLFAAVSEAGFYSSGLSSGNQGLLCHNQRLYYGTGGSC